MIRAEPGFAAAAILALGLCMAANSTLFTVVNALLLRPLPFPDSERLVEISIPEHRVDLADLEGARWLESAGAFAATMFAVRSAGEVRNIFGFRVTPELIPLLGVRPALGRALARSDGAAKVLMISFEYWKSLGSPALADISLLLDGEAYSVIGVLPDDFFLGVRDAKLIVPDLRTGERTIARLRPGATPAQAQAEVAGLLPGKRVAVTPLARALQGSDSRPVVLLLATAGFVLLITCANLANLQLVRGLKRRREFAIRTAMGASHARLVGQLTAESALLAAGGVVIGLAETRALHDLIPSVLPVNIARRLAGADALALDARVLVFTAGVAFVTILLFGLAPAFGSLRFDVMTGLREAGRGSIGGRQRYGQALVTVEIGLTLMLLAGAGLTFKNLTRLQQQYLGFRPAGVLRAMVDFSATRYPRPEQKAALSQEVERRLGGIPSVSRVGIVAPQAFPFGGPAVNGKRFEIFERPDVEARAEVYAANPAYLEAIGLPLLKGRWFTESDTASSQPVAVLSETVARRYWGEEECIGRRVRLRSDGSEGVWATIIGVVGDVKNPVAVQWQPTAYRPFAQTPSSGATLLIRVAAGDPLLVAPLVRRELHAIDADAPEFRIVAALDAAVRDYVSPQRFTTRMLAVFAAIGLAIAVNGVYGVMRYWVVSRRGEFGIRMALGAQPWNVLGLALGRAAAAAACGVVGGVGGAMALRQVIAAQLTGMSAWDPVVLGVAVVATGGAALAAAWFPARMASRTDPAEVLRAE
jgi:putative ABC transport system permease protein